MPIQRINVGTNEDGTPRYQYIADGSGHVVITGPISGTVTLPDGTVVDVSEPVIEVPSPEVALAVSDAIGARHVAEGHPDFVADPKVDSYGFTHIPSTEV